MASTDPLKIAYGTYKFLKAAKGIYDNYNKLKEAVKTMIEGGLGIQSCSAMSAEIRRLNAELENAH